MGCGCKGDNVNEVVVKEPISVKLVLKKIGAVIVMSLLLLLLTPFIVVLIWYYGIGSIFGGKTNTLNALLKYVKDKKEGYVEEDDDEVIADEYELVDVNEIK